jgi:hypothetical protein
MSSISSITGGNSLSYLQPTSSGTQRVAGGDSDGDSDGQGGAGNVGKSNFMSAISQALGQTTGTSAATSTSATSGTDPQAALQGFLQNLFSSLSQANGTPATGKQKTDADGDGGRRSVSGVSGQGSNISANLQNLLQQLAASSQATSSATGTNAADPLSALNSSFQNLISSITASQGQTATTQGQTATTQGQAVPVPTLQSFLQNLMQSMGNGQNISGALVSTTA